MNQRALEQTKRLPEIGEDFRQYVEHIGTKVLNLMFTHEDAGALQRAEARRRRESEAIRSLSPIPLH